MKSFLHILGFSGDHHTHINFIDYIIYLAHYDINTLLNLTITELKTKIRLVKLLLNKFIL